MVCIEHVFEERVLFDAKKRDGCVLIEKKLRDFLLLLQKMDSFSMTNIHRFLKPLNKIYIKTDQSINRQQQKA